MSKGVAGYTSPGHVPSLYKTPDNAPHTNLHDATSDAIDLVAAAVPNSVTDLIDVDLTGIVDGDVTAWDAASGKLKPKTISGTVTVPTVDWPLVPLHAADGTVTTSTDAYIGGVPVYRACKLDEIHPVCDEANMPTGGSASGYVYLAGSGLSTPTENGTATTGGNTNVASHTIAYPAAVAAGRVARIFGFHATKTITVSTPSGWTSRVNYTESTGSDYGRIFCFEKVLIGSESGTVTITTSAATDISTIMLIDSGENTAAGPVVGSVTFSFTNSLTIPAAAPSSANDRLIGVIGQAGNPANTATFPTAQGWTTLPQSKHGNSCIAVGVKTSGTTTPTSVTVSLDTTLNEMGFMLALQATVTPLISWTIGEGTAIGHVTAQGKSLSQWDRLHYAVTAAAGCKGLKLLHKFIDP